MVYMHYFLFLFYIIKLYLYVENGVYALFFVFILHYKVVFIGVEWCICTSFYLHPNLQRCKCAIRIPFLHILWFLRIFILRLWCIPM